MSERRISSREDFPHVAVYRRDGPRGPLYGIVFENREWPSGGVEAGRVLLALIWSIVLLPVGCDIMMNTENPFVGLGAAAVCLVVVAATWNWAKSPVSVKRVIELDKGADRLRIYGNGHLEIQRSLQRLALLDIKEHPNAALAREERAEHPEDRWRRKISRAEQQHCLFGYFGPGGADQVLLLSRVEWPCLNSLREVREAVLWAKDKMDREDGGSRDEGMNPPRR